MRRRRLVVSLWVMLIVTAISRSSIMADDNLVVQRMTPMKKDKYANDVEKTALAWADMFLTDQYAPSKKMRYVYLPAKGNQDVDMLRMRYDVGGETVTLTQTICMFAISVSRDASEEVTGGRREQEVQELARRIFRDGGDLVLVSVSQSDRRLEGHSKPGESRKAAKWLENLQWFWDDGEVRFMFIKDDGKPSEMDKGPDFESNARWFRGRTIGSKRKKSK